LLARRIRSAAAKPSALQRFPSRIAAASAGFDFPLGKEESLGDDQVEPDSKSFVDPPENPPGP
jgi:hypothetical protein